MSGRPKGPEKENVTLRLNPRVLLRLRQLKAFKDRSDGSKSSWVSFIERILWDWVNGEEGQKLWKEFGEEIESDVKKVVRIGNLKKRVKDWE